MTPFWLNFQAWQLVDRSSKSSHDGSRPKSKIGDSLGEYIRERDGDEAERCQNQSNSGYQPLHYQSRDPVVSPLNNNVCYTVEIRGISVG